MSLTVTEAQAVNDLLRFLLQPRVPGDVDESQALDAAVVLVRSANKRLGAGLMPTQVREAWRGHPLVRPTAAAFVDPAAPKHPSAPPVGIRLEADGAVANCPECDRTIVGRDDAKGMVPLVSAHLHEEHPEAWPMDRILYGLRFELPAGLAS